MAYKLTAADRRRQAALMRAQSTKRYTPKKVLNPPKAKAEEKPGTLARVGATAGDMAANVLTGLGKGIEGIWDFSVGLRSSLVSVFSEKFRDKVQDLIAKDFTGDWYGDALQEATHNSYLNGNKAGQITEGIAQGVGQILPAVAISYITGGAAAPSQMAALATTMTSAAGTATEEAFQDGAGYGEGMAYGAVSGAIEGATEKLTGGLGGLYGKGLVKTGKAALKEGAEQVAKTGLKRVLSEAAGEGVEEMISELAAPATKTIYKGRDALAEYGDADYWKGVGEAGIIGAGTSIAYGGSVGRITKTSGVYADARSVMEDIDAQTKALADLESKGKLTTERETAAAKRIKADYEKLSEVLQRANPKARERILANPVFSAAFESDGALRASVVTNLDARVQYVEQGSGGEMLSRGLWGNEQAVNEQLAANGTRIYEGELTEAETENLSRLRKAHTALSRKGLIGTEFVIAEESSSFSAYLDDKTVVIGKDTLTDGTYLRKLVHEVEHFTEGTKEWTELAAFVFEKTNTDAAVAAVLQSGYGVTQADVDTLLENFKSGKLTKGQRTLISEVVASQSEALFGDEQTIARLTRTNRSLAEKILDRIKAFLEVFTAKTPEEKAEVRRMQRAKQLFEQALGKAGTKYAVREMQSAEKGDVVLDGESVVGYNNTVPQFSTKRAKYISYDKLGASNVAFIRRQLYKLYQGVENGIANSVAIENGNTVYIVDSGCENGDISFGVRERRIVTDAQLRAEIIRRRNNESLSKGYISDGLSSRFGDRHDNGIDSSVRRESGAELSADTAESADIQEGVSAGDADRGRSGVTQYSREQQSTPTESGEGAVGYNDTVPQFSTKRANQDLYTATKDFVREVAFADRHDFTRWLSYKTTGMRKNEIRNITIYCSERVYFFKADGYMHGKMYRSRSVKHKNVIIEIRKAWDNENNQNVDTIDSLADAFAIERGRTDFDSDITGYGPGTSGFDGFSFESSSSDTRRDNGGSGTDYRIDYDEVDRIIKALREMVAKTDEEPHRQFSRKFLGSRDVAYTEAQYRDFGWVRDNDVIPNGAWQDFTSKFAAALSGRVHPPITKGGEYMIAVSDIDDPQAEGVNNIIVYATGTIESPKVSRVLTIDLDNETELDRKRREIYEGEWRGIQPAFEDIFRFYYSSDFEFHRPRASRTGIGDSERNGQRGRSGKTSDRIKEFKVNEDGSFTTVYADGRTEVQYSRKIVGSHDAAYTEAQYRDFGWVRDNDVIPSGAWENFTSKFAAALSGREHPPKTKGGEYMIAVSDIDDPQAEGVNNIIVYATGTMESPKVSRVLMIDLDNETSLDEQRRDIYALEGRGIQQTSGGLFHLYAATDSRYQRYGQGNRAQSGGHYDQLGADRGRGSKTSDRIKEFKVNEDGSFTTVYADGRTEVQYSRKPTGAAIKADADVERLRVYTKKDAEAIIADVVGQYMVFESEGVYGQLVGKSQREAIEALWRGLNSAEPGMQGGVALDIAEYIINNATVASVWEQDTTEQTEEAKRRLAILRGLMHKLDLSSIKDEIAHKLDDKKGTAYLVWGARKGQQGLSLDGIAAELVEQGLPITAEHPADIFFEIMDLHRKAVDALQGEAASYLAEVMTAEERHALKQDIAKEILRAFDTKGAPSKLARTIVFYEDQLSRLRAELKDARNANGVINRVLDKAQRLRDLKAGRYLTAAQYREDIFRGSIGRLAAIKYRGNLREASVRGIVSELASWYHTDNPLYKGEDALKLNGEILEMMKEISGGEGRLTNAELDMLGKVMDFFVHEVENFNKVYREGKWQEARPIAKKHVDGLHTAKRRHRGGVLTRIAESGYMRMFADPLSLMRRADAYEQGFFTESFENLRKGAIKAAVTKQRLLQQYEGFFKKHKGYDKRYFGECITYRGQLIAVNDAISLYMTMHREQAYAGLARAGYQIDVVTDYKARTSKKAAERAEGFATPTEPLSQESLKKLMETERAKLKKQFTADDLKMIEMMEDIFRQCAELKKVTDLTKQGYTNLTGGYYYPIKRAQTADKVDRPLDELSRVTGLSFNKDTVQGAKGELRIEAADVVLKRHIDGIAIYAGLAIETDNINRLLNLNIAEDKHKPVSIKSEIGVSTDFVREMWRFFKKLQADVEGASAKPQDQRAYDKWVRFIRGGYAKYQLGANPKVWFTQLSSLVAATNLLDTTSIVRGLGVSGKDVDSYCELAWLRNVDDHAAKAETVLDNVGKVGDFLMKPIGTFDRMVVVRLFAACQVEVERKQGLTLGTVENKRAAGELLERVILDTQQNSLATERSVAMRSPDEFLKGFTMFSADAMKGFGRFIDAISEVAVLREELKRTHDPKRRAALEERLKAAKTQARKSTSALVGTALFGALVALGFKWLYNKDDEETLWSFLADAFGNMLGGLPLVRDVYSFFQDGFEMDHFLIATGNTVLKAVSDTVGLVTDSMNGKKVERRDVLSAARKVLYAAGQLAGIPTRNIYNVAYGLTKRTSEPLAYAWDSNFTKKSYSVDLEKALAAGDDKMVATIAGLMIDEKIGIEDDKTRSVLKGLAEQGLSVLPRAVGDTVTLNGEERNLTGKQQKRFRTVYGVAEEAVADLVCLKRFGEADAPVQAKAVQFIYDVYWNLALEDVLGEDLAEKNVLFAEAIDIEKLANIIAMARSIEADKDKNGKAIAGTKKRKVEQLVSSLHLTAAQKYMVMGYLGYTNANGREQVERFIGGLKLTKGEKKALLKYSGYEAA
ncbi:MAG: hypothetical protein IJC99_04250 [Clostridia bacterium]|nr:hypothetical protein [Clostridia bacterium]